MGGTDRDEDAPRAPEEPEEPEGRDRADGSGASPAEGAASGAPAAGVPSDEEAHLGDGEVPDDLHRRFEARGRYVKQLHDELAAARLAADEARARAAAGQTRVRDLEGERDRLRERGRELEDEERRRRRRREGQDRLVARLHRELDRRDAEIGHLKAALEARRGEMEARGLEADETIARKSEALEEALRRVEEGTYGLSVVSGEPIPEERLEAKPDALYRADEVQAYLEGTRVGAGDIRGAG